MIWTTDGVADEFEDKLKRSGPKMSTWFPVKYVAFIKHTGIPGRPAYAYALRLTSAREYDRVEPITIDLQEDGVAFAAWMSVLSTGRAEYNYDDMLLRVSGEPTVTSN